MTTSEIVQAIDQEIAKLQRVRTLLQESTSIAKRGPGRPPKAMKSAAAPAKGKKRTLSAEARAKIAAAQKARWAKAKKS